MASSTPWRRAGRMLAFALMIPALSLAAAWTALALYFTFPVPLARPLTAGAFVALALGALSLRRYRRRAIVGAAGVAAIAVIGFAASEPANDRDWRPEVAIAPSIDFDGSRFTVAGLRNFIYRSRDDFTGLHETRSYDFDALRAVDLVVSYWGSERLAHTMLSFDFGGEDVLGLSVEARLEMGERWGPIAGMFRQYELVDVLADERDLIGLRASHRGEEVYLFRLAVTPDAGRRLLERILADANRLRARPRFYCTLLRNCTTTLVDHVNAIWPDQIPYVRKIFMNGYSPERAYEQGLIQSDLPFPELKERCRITATARGAAGTDDFSRRIRNHLLVE